MLEAVDLPKPKRIFTTWFFTVDGQKMSKSLWNVVEPLELLEKYGRDAISLYLFYDIKIGKDGDFSYARFKDVYNNILIWGWGNLVYRISKLSEKFGINKAKKSPDFLNFLSPDSNTLLKAILDKNAEQKIEEYIEKVDYQTYLKNWYELIQATNKFVQDTAPWKVMKEDEQKWISILETAVYLIHKINLLGSFFFIESFEKINNIFWFKHFDNSKNFDGFFEELYKDDFEITAKPEIVFKKLENNI